MAIAMACLSVQTGRVTISYRTPYQLSLRQACSQAEQSAWTYLHQPAVVPSSREVLPTPQQDSDGPYPPNPGVVPSRRAVSPNFMNSLLHRFFEDDG